MMKKLELTYVNLDPVQRFNNCLTASLITFTKNSLLKSIEILLLIRHKSIQQKNYVFNTDRDLKHLVSFM